MGALIRHDKNSSLCSEQYIFYHAALNSKAREDWCIWIDPHLQIVINSILCSFGASPFLSTLRVDTMSFGSSAVTGCYAALSTAASHGQRAVLHKLVRLTCSSLHPIFAS